MLKFDLWIWNDSTWKSCMVYSLPAWRRGKNAFICQDSGNLHLPCRGKSQFFQICHLPLTPSFSSLMYGIVLGPFITMGFKAFTTGFCFQPLFIVVYLPGTKVLL